MSTARDLLRPAGRELVYDVRPGELPKALSERFVRLDLGEEGRAYLERALSTRPGRTRTALQRLLRGVMSDFDANGLLGMYPMHLLGTSQWRELLGASATRRHLDVGAGSGDVTRTIAPLARETVTVETSRVMARNLRRNGFSCHEVDLAEGEVPEPHYDLVTCLNVIDRCRRPRSLLAKLAAAVAPGGRLVVATPLPFDPFVYDGARTLTPVESLGVGTGSWERAVATLVEHEIEPLGLVVERLTRVPYLCQGDADAALYVLDDALLVCRKCEDAP